MRRLLGYGARRLSAVLALALLMSTMPLAGAVSAGAAASSFTGGADNDPPVTMLNDHTPYAIHFTGGGDGTLEPSTTYYVKVRLTVGTGPSGVTNRGWTYNPTTGQWVQEREDWSLFPTVTTDASGLITSNAGWFWAKFGDETKAGDYHILISLSKTGSASTYNASVAPTVTVLDAATDGAWIHNGVTIASGSANKRVEATDMTTTTPVYSLQKTEPNLVDDDGNGVVDDENYGPAATNTSDYRLGVPATPTVDIRINRTVIATGNDVAARLADTDIALGAADMTPPSAPAGADATADGNAVNVAWTAATDDVGVQDYRVYRRLAAPLGAQYTNPWVTVGTTADTTLTDGALADGDYEYFVRATDAATNVSARSAVVPVSVDTSAPAAVTDLAVTGRTSDSVSLEWLAPGDDGLTGTATAYDVRYSTQPIDETNFFDAAEAPAGVPSSVGTTDSVTVNGLQPLTTYYFALKTLDEVGNASAISNVATAMTSPTTATERASGSDRYAAASNAAAIAFPGWTGVTDVVIASGEDAAAADALSAAGLAGAYRAPLLLVQSATVPASVSAALADMPDGVKVHVVGGPKSVSANVLAALDAIPGVDTPERIAGATRYSTAVAVAEAMASELGAALGDSVLVANGADPSKFLDALALSAVAYRMNYPILLVSAMDVPAETSAEIEALDPVNVYVGGGPKTVSPAVMAEVGSSEANRLWGADRYGTAVAIADRGTAEGWFVLTTVGVSAKLADGLSGGATMGELGGPMVFTQPATLPASTGGFLSSNSSVIERAIVFGGPASVTPAIETLITQTINP